MKIFIRSVADFGRRMRDSFPSGGGMAQTLGTEKTVTKLRADGGRRKHGDTQDERHVQDRGHSPTMFERLLPHPG
jgi:hypothetical protein